MDRQTIITVVRGMIYAAEREFIKRLRMAIQYMRAQGVPQEELSDILDKAILDVMKVIDRLE